MKTSLGLLAATVSAVLALSSVGVQAQTSLAKIKEQGKVVIGTRDSSAPLAYTTGNGKYVGYHVEICERIVDAIKTNLGMPNLKTEYTLVTSQNRVPLVTNGTVDLECGSTTNNATRAQQVAFAPTTFVTNVRMVVKADSKIKSIADLGGKTVVTTTGTTSVQLLRKNKRGSNLQFNEILGKDHADSFLVMSSGRADVFVMDDNILAGLIVNAQNPADFKIVGETLSEEPIAIMYRKDDPGFKVVVDNAVKSMMSSKEIDKIYAKWFMQKIPPRDASVNMPMSASLKKAIANPNTDPAESYVVKQ